ncbi:MAG: hypothetical protein O3A37_00360 [Planctomycetota bacterium]|nr:hypothetical protein [Planctomycetota bacterium]
MALPHWLILVGGTLALLASSTDPRRFVLVMIFTLPFNGAFVEVGQRLELFKVASLIALPVAAFRLPRLLDSGACGGLGVFACWSAWIMLLTFWFPPEYLNFEGDGMRSMGLRLGMQGTLLLSRVTLAGLCIMSLRTPQDVLAAVRTWVAATTVLAGFGLLEEACHFIGFNVGGVYYDGLLNGSPTHLVHDVSGIAFKRVGSLAHEPKMLARWLIPSLVVLLCDAASGFRVTLSRFRNRLLIAVHLAALVFTFSTSGYLVFLMSTAIPILAMGTSAATAWRYCSTIAALVVIAGPWALGLDAVVQAVIAEKYSRYGGFVQGGTDGPALNFFAAYPWAALWGSGLSTQGFYLPEFISADFEFVYENVMERGFGGFGVESGWLSLLLDTGCIGIAAILAPVASRWACGTRMLHRLAGRPEAADACTALRLTRCVLAACLVGMVAYPLEGVGLLAVSVGMASAAISSASRRYKDIPSLSAPDVATAMHPFHTRKAFS